MRPASKLFFCIAIAILIWLLDSSILAASSNISFAAALWSGVSALRLLVRLVVCLLLLFYAVLHYTAEEVRFKERIRINKADSGALFGNPDSTSTSQRILYHALRLATMLNMKAKDKHNLRLLCYCYELGLVGVPTAVLEKSAPLSKSEQAEYDRHLDLGAAIAANLAPLRKAAPLIACHEEHYNGGGPKAMYGRSIPLACRVFTTVRLFDQFCQSQPKRSVPDINAALSEMAFYRGSLLDPEVYDAFLRLMQDRRLSSQVAERVYSPR